jgi:hypothetical protein
MRFYAANIGFCAVTFARMIPMVSFCFSAFPGDESPGYNIQRAGWHFFSLFLTRHHLDDKFHRKMVSFNKTIEFSHFL